MALGGGTFLVQNKVLPGAYINFVSKPRALGGLGERGTVCIPLELDWGKDGMMTVEASEFQKNSMNIFGYSFNSPQMLPLRELFRYAKVAKIFRLNSGEKARATIGEIKITAKYGGIRGNDIQIVIERNLDDDTVFNVKTYLGKEEVDNQSVKAPMDLKENEFVSFQGEKTFTATSGISLSGGTNKPVDGGSYMIFLDAAEKESFQVLAYPGDDAITKIYIEAFTKRMRNEEGVKFVTVLFDHRMADFEGIISVTNYAEEERQALVYWTAGACAGAEVNQSLTNRKYDGEYTVLAKYKKSEFEKGIQQGKFMFYEENGEIRVLSDINTFVSYETSKNSDFSSNRVIRVLDSIANDIAGIFSKYYLGKQSNNANGRNLLKTEIIRYHEQLQSIEAIEDFTAEDIIVQQGTGKRDVIIYENVKPTDAMEKVYMMVKVA